MNECDPACKNDQYTAVSMAKNEISTSRHFVELLANNDK